MPSNRVHKALLTRRNAQLESRRPLLRNAKPRPRRPRAGPQIITTVVVDKCELFRAGLVHTLAETRFRVAAECARLDELDRSAFGFDKCYVLLLGIDDCSESELEPYISDLRKLCDLCYVVFLGTKLEKAALASIISMGGAGYMAKHTITSDVLVRSLDIVISGSRVFSQDFMSELQREWLLKANVEGSAHEDAAPDPKLSVHSPASAVEAGAAVRLSDRERAILAGLMRGESNKHIARHLHIAEATVKVHVKSVLRKIRVKNRTQAALWAWSHQEALDDRRAAPPRTAAKSPFSLEPFNAGDCRALPVSDARTEEPVQG